MEEGGSDQKRRGGWGSQHKMVKDHTGLPANNFDLHNSFFSMTYRKKHRQFGHLQKELQKEK